MKDYITKIKSTNNLSVCFYIEQDKIMEIGEQMNGLNESAYMNGYNWEAFLNHYLEKNYPDLLAGMNTDPEAGMYTAYYDSDNEQKADRLIEVIKNLVKNEAVLYQFVKDEGGNIEWD